MSFAYLFPGQGSHAPNMAQWILDEYPLAKTLFEKASEKLGFDLKGGEKLEKSEYCQPAILLTSYCYYRYSLDCYGFNPSYLCGHSLGEFTALVAAEAIDLFDALSLVKYRGHLMDSICAKESGGMLAVINYPLHELQERLENFNARIPSTDLPLVIGGFSSPKEFVVSGKACLLATLQESLRKDHVVSMPLKVAGAFHHPMMHSIKQSLSQKLKDTKINKPKIKVLSPTTETILEDPSRIYLALIKQIDNPVQWLACVKKLLADHDVDVFVDVGPRAILTKTIKDALAKQVFKLRHLELISLFSQNGRKKIRELKGQKQIKVLCDYLAQLACTPTKGNITPDQDHKIIEIYSDVQQAVSHLKEPGKSNYLSEAKFYKYRDQFIEAMDLKGGREVEVK